LALETQLPPAAIPVECPYPKFWSDVLLPGLSGGMMLPAPSQPGITYTSVAHPSGIPFPWLYTQCPASRHVFGSIIVPEQTYHAPPPAPLLNRSATLQFALHGKVLRVEIAVIVPMPRGRNPSAPIAASAGRPPICSPPFRPGRVGTSIISVRPVLGS
jgi:hypothetical protein